MIGLLLESSIGNSTYTEDKPYNHMSVRIAVQRMKEDGQIRLDRLLALGVSEQELAGALATEGLTFTVDDRSGPGGLFDDGAKEGDPEDIWLDLRRPVLDEDE